MNSDDEEEEEKEEEEEEEVWPSVCQLGVRCVWRLLLFFSAA